MYYIDSRIRISETNHKGVVSLPGIVNYFQDCSVLQSEDLGLGMGYLKEHKKAWILNSWQIVVENYPALGEAVRVGTWASGFDGLYGTRNFVMLDKEGKKLAYANSVWVFMDMEKGRPVRPTAEDTAPYGCKEPLEMEYAPRKIALPKEPGEPQSPIIVKRSDIDTNEHMNNCIYIKIAMDVLKEEVDYSHVRVEYKRSAVLGDVMIPWIVEEDDRTVVKLCDEQEKPFAIVEVKR